MAEARRSCVTYLTIAGAIFCGACKHAPRTGDTPPDSPFVLAPAPTLAQADSTSGKVPVEELPPSVSTSVRMRAGDLRMVNTFVLNVPLPSDSGECAPRERSPTGEGFTVMVMYPSRAAPTAVSMVLLTSDDRLIRFTDRRGGLRLPPMPGLTREQADSAIATFLRATPQTTITLEYFAGRATVVNAGANRQSNGFTVPIRYIADHERYGAPDTRARAIVARCR